VNVRPLSDLHLEYHADGGKEFIRSLRTDGDVLVLAGDIARMDVGIERTLARFRAQFSCPIVLVHGNHEFHKSNRNTIVRATRNAVSQIRGVHWLDSDLIEIDGQRILGTPLWFGRSPAPLYPVVSTDEEWQRGFIRAVGKDQHGKTAVLDDTQADFEFIEDFHQWVYDENERAIRFLDENLREGDIVVSHYLPSRQSTPPRFDRALSNCWFVSNVEPLILDRKPALWIHGHTHDSVDYRIGTTRVVCNPMGYAGHENVAFDDTMLVEV